MPNQAFRFRVAHAAVKPSRPDPQKHPSTQRPPKPRSLLVQTFRTCTQSSPKREGCQENTGQRRGHSKSRISTVSADLEDAQIPAIFGQSGSQASVFRPGARGPRLPPRCRPRLKTSKTNPGSSEVESPSVLAEIRKCISSQIYASSPLCFACSKVFLPPNPRAQMGMCAPGFDSSRLG